ncbi:hypothetical protein [Undibacterium macrobrachii]|uniref:Uncharacterized protein n=1 Tax=Undibacterium macrobrachii TaxID=1119058 RepID=A0ABQ2XHL8_9BURK|nr:hypothetical protein [Undibacterium macrobrachii]GGX17370.1 hypothetical protein GCM10011282_24280 [Undibacterium macrobrachii]
MKSNLSMFFSTVRCFNVAAIVALAIWHGYVFYLNEAIQRTPTSPVIELKLTTPSNAPSDHASQVSI